jgi:hypothetical protein
MSKITKLCGILISKCRYVDESEAVSRAFR